MNIEPKQPVAVGYCRAEHSHELDQLKARIREFAAAEGFHFRGLHCDRGRVANGLRSARGLALALGAECLIVANIGQFGRSHAFALGIIDALDRDGIRVVSIAAAQSAVVAHEASDRQGGNP